MPEGRQPWFWAVSVLVAIPGCSFAGLFNELPQARCRVDSDCRALDSARDPCVVGVCNVDLGRCVTSVPDRDRDGHARTGCDGADVTVRLPTDDCDDDRVEVHPGAPDYCDGLDTDCSSGGGIDSSEDADGDGHARSPATSRECIPRPPTDCDDHDPTRHPDATERCNGLDDDCDGVVDNGAAAAECASMPPPGASSVCSAGRCRIERCNAGYADCDGLVANGCEVDLRSDVASCGRCGVHCVLAASCASGECQSGIGALTAGATHTCLRRTSGGVACWGSNVYGQCGTPPVASTTGPVHAEAVTDSLALAAGATHTCVLRSGGTVACFGDHRAGQLGDGREYGSASPVAVEGLSDAVEVSAGGVDGSAGHACARRAGGAVVCWGDNSEGQLGLGAISPAERSPRPVMGLSDAVEIAAGGRHTCARRAGAGVICWGDNSDGQLGPGAAGAARSTTPVSVPGLENAVQLAAGARHTCALRATGEVVCWGRDGLEHTGPFAVAPELARIAQVAAGEAFTCARQERGVVFCWGENDVGQLGHLLPLRSARPLEVPEASVVTALTLGARHACAVSDGWVVCWGDNRRRQLGSAGSDSRAMPDRVNGL